MATEFIPNEFPTEEPIWIDNYFRTPRILFGSEVRQRSTIDDDQEDGVESSELPLPDGPSC